MEDNEVELKDAKPGMWATFDIPEPIDDSDFHAEAGHYEGVIVEPSSDCMLAEMFYAVTHGHDVTRLSVDGSVFGLKKGMNYGFALIENGERLDKGINKAFTNVHVYKTKPGKNTEPESYEELPCDNPGFYIDSDGDAWCVDDAGNAWLFSNGHMHIRYKSDGCIYWHAPFRKAKLVAA